MSSMVVWLIGITLSICILVVLAGADMGYAHAFVCVAINVAVLFLASRDNEALAANSANEAEVTAHNARYVAIIWAWAALVMATTYTAVLSWNEWWHFVVGFAAAAGFATLLSSMLKASANEPDKRERLFKVARVFAWVQIVGMIVLAIGLIVDNKMDKLGISPFGVRNNPPEDWAANNVFFFGGLALAAVSWLGLKAAKAARGR